MMNGMHIRQRSIIFPAVSYACGGDFKYHLFALYHKAALVGKDSAHVLLKPEKNLLLQHLPEVNGPLSAT